MKWDAKPPVRNTREDVVRLVRVPPGANWHVVCTATRLATVQVHFLDGRTMPCQAAEMECKACRAGLSRKFEAYMGAWNVTRQQEQLIALPALAYETIAGNLHDALDGGLRGHGFKLVRRGESRRGPLDVECLGRGAGDGVIPRGLDVPKILLRCWGMSPTGPATGVFAKK